MTSTTNFPQGLKALSSTKLSRAREFVLEHFFRNLTLEGAHLNALIKATVEMDIDKSGAIDAYIQKLINHKIPSNLHPFKRDFTSNQRDDGHSSILIEDILKRQAAFSCLSSTEKCLDTLLEIIKTDISAGHHSGTSPMEEQPCRLILWDIWRSNGLFYLLDKRTVRLLSGSNLIFSAPKIQWTHILENLKGPNEVHESHNKLLEIVELALLYLISSSWKSLIQHIVSLSCDKLPFFGQEYVLHTSLPVFHFRQSNVLANSKDKNLTEYLTFLLSSHPSIFWSLSPILVCAAVSSCPKLFQIYLDNLEQQLNAKDTTVSICTCSQDGKTHVSCEVAERIWWLHVFHSQDHLLMIDT